MPIVIGKANASNMNRQTNPAQIGGGQGEREVARRLVAQPAAQTDMVTAAVTPSARNAQGADDADGDEQQQVLVVEDPVLRQERAQAAAEPADSAAMNSNASEKLSVREEMLGSSPAPVKSPTIELRKFGVMRDASPEDRPRRRR